MEWMLSSFYFLRQVIVWIAVIAAMIAIFKGIFGCILRRKKATTRFWVNFFCGMVYLLTFGYLIGAYAGMYADIFAILYLMIVVVCTQFNKPPKEPKPPK